MEVAEGGKQKFSCFIKRYDTAVQQNLRNKWMNTQFANELLFKGVVRRTDFPAGSRQHHCFTFSYITRALFESDIYNTIVCQASNYFLPIEKADDSSEFIMMKKPLKKLYRLHRKHISYVAHIIEGYEGLATVTTLDNKKAIIQIVVYQEGGHELDNLIRSLSQEVELQEVIMYT